MVKNRIIHILFVLLSIITISAVCNAQVRVKGYYRKDGAYVRPHVRSNPDGNPYNNWSYPGNVNPYTGKVATGNPETYLKKYREDGNRFFRDNMKQKRFQILREGCLLMY